MKEGFLFSLFSWSLLCWCTSGWLSWHSACATTSRSVLCKLIFSSRFGEFSRLGMNISFYFTVLCELLASTALPGFSPLLCKAKLMLATFEGLYWSSASPSSAPGRFSFRAGLSGCFSPSSLTTTASGFSSATGGLYSALRFFACPKLCYPTK